VSITAGISSKGAERIYLVLLRDSKTPLPGVGPRLPKNKV